MGGGCVCVGVSLGHLSICLLSLRFLFFAARRWVGGSSKRGRHFCFVGSLGWGGAAVRGRFEMFCAFSFRFALFMWFVSLIVLLLLLRDSNVPATGAAMSGRAVASSLSPC